MGKPFVYWKCHEKNGRIPILGAPSRKVENILITPKIRERRHQCFFRNSTTTTAHMKCAKLRIGRGKHIKNNYQASDRMNFSKNTQRIAISSNSDHLNQEHRVAQNKKNMI